MGSRSVTQGTLVAAAESLYLARGLGPVSMEEVAAAAGCTRRTLYRYYSAKEDLAFDVATGLLERWNRDQSRLWDQASGTGAQRLRAFLEGTVEVLDGQRAALRYLGEFDFVFRDGTAYAPDDARAARFRSASGLSEVLIARMLDQGEADGSLVLTVPKDRLVPTLSSALWSLAQRVALRDEHLLAEFGVAGLDLVRTQIDLTLCALTGGPHGTL